MNRQSKMRLFGRCAAAAVCAGILGTALADSGDFANELRGLRFGMARQQAGELVKPKTRAGLQFYERPGRRRETYYDVLLGHIFYGFRDDKLEVVELWAASIFCAPPGLKQELTRRFGKPVYRASNNEAWRQREAGCSLQDPAGCDTEKFEGFPRAPNLKGIVAWYTEYFHVGGTRMCRYRVRFSPSSRTRTEHDKAEKEWQDMYQRFYGK